MKLSRDFRVPLNPYDGVSTEGYICGAKKFEIKVPPIARKYTTPTQNCLQNPFLKSFLVRNDVNFSPIGLNKEKSTPGYPKMSLEKMFWPN